MKLSEQLQQNHESGDFGLALEDYTERAIQLEAALESIAQRIKKGDITPEACRAIYNTAMMGLHNSQLD
jgi:hypothetical protein